MKAEAVKSIIQAELPKIVKTDPEIQDLVLDLARAHFASKEETESRFDRVMNRMERDRQEQRRQWDAWIAEDRRKWDKYIAEREKDREEQRQLWAENKAEREKDREEYQQFLAENRRQWDEHKAQQDQLWAQYHIDQEKSRQETRQLIKDSFRKVDSRLGALGARWGIQSETSFRNGLKAILEETTCACGAPANE
jgi:hypothetical protein